MKTETVNRVAEFLEELSYLTNTEEYSFNIAYELKGFYYHGTTKYKSISKSFFTVIKDLTIGHIKEQIDNIDKELEQL